MSATDLLNLLIAALLLAGVYAVMSVGMTIIYGVMKIVNLAHAGFLMLGAYFVYELYTTLALTHSSVCSWRSRSSFSSGRPFIGFWCAGSQSRISRP